jgi:hypothetical protein
MQQGGRLSFWLQPILHPSTLVFYDDISGSCYVLVQGCGFCKRGFISYDAAIISCKHNYHPFCLVQLCRKDNKCHVCKEVFHPEWWAS